MSMVEAAQIALAVAHVIDALEGEDED